MNITKEMDKNFWKCIGVIIVAVITVFFIKMTNCVCHLTSVMESHFSVRENMTNSGDQATEDVIAKANQLKGEAGQAKAKAGQAELQAKAEAGKAASQAKAEAGKAEAQAKAEAGKAEAKAKAEAGKAEAKANQLKGEAEAEANQVKEKAKNALSNIFGGSTSSSNNSSSSTGGTTSLTESSEGIDDEEEEKEEQRKEQREQEKQNKLTELKKDYQNKVSKVIMDPIQESFTCDINSPTKIVAQYANIESLTKDCDKRIDTCSILKVKDKITGGNLYLDSYRQESYASATGWHS